MGSHWESDDTGGRESATPWKGEVMSQPVDLAALRAVLDKRRYNYYFAWRNEQGVWTLQVPEGWVAVGSDKATQEEFEALAKLSNAAPALLTELEQLRLERDSWQQAAITRAQDQAVLERKLEAVTAELRGKS